MPLRPLSLLSHISPFAGQKTGNTSIIGPSLTNISPSSSILPSLLTSLDTTLNDPIRSSSLSTITLYDDGNETPERPHQAFVMVANWLSLVGSLAIILHVPLVTQRVPSQTKRMVIILFTAMSNFGFSLSNIVTDIANITDTELCSVSAWCYVFFQILTCTLVITSTFRLCGVFLFTERRSIPSKYIALCPFIAFVLATTPAAAGNFSFDECSHYCWFKLLPDQQTCRIKSLWAWLCFYAWMILFLSILFGSTIFVMIRIATAVYTSRRNLKSVANQPLDYVVVEVPTSRPSSPPIQSLPITEILRPQEHITERQNSHVHVSSRETPTFASLGLDIPVIYGGSAQTESSLNNPQSQTQDDPQPPHITAPNVIGVSHSESIAILRAKERPFFVAILRQSLYPITISLSGCLQIIADLTLIDPNNYDSAFGYVSNVATSIQGFLFFLVFMFDPAMIQTRKQWRKYWIWRYYIEFYYGLGMPQEGRSFGDRFMENCSSLNQYGNEAKFDELTKPPSYSWTLQDLNIVTPDFQTTHPLANPIPNTTLNTAPGIIFSPQSYGASSSGGRRGSSRRVLDRDGHGVGYLSTSLSRTREGGGSYINPSPGSTNNNGEGSSPVESISMEEELSKDNSNDTNNKVSATATEYTNHFQDLSPDAPLPPTNSDNDDVITVQSNVPPPPPPPSPPPPPPSPSPSPSLPQDGATAISVSPTGLESGVDETPSKEEGECSEPPSMSQHPKHRSGSEASYDSGLFDDDLSFDPDLERTMASSQRPPISAPQPGDVLSFHGIKRMRTIGGSELNPRRNMSTTDRVPKVTPRRKGTMSAGRMAGFKDGSLGFGYRLKHILWPGHKDEDAVKKQYQRQFKYPRCAYLMHLMVRQVFIPRKARLPKITNPLKEHRDSSNSSLNDVLPEVARPHVPSPQVPDSIQSEMVGEQDGAVRG